MIGDFFTVARYFVISIVFVGVLQVETKGKSLEGHLTEWFYTSTVPSHIRTAAKGGALAIETGVHSTRRFFKDTFSSASSAVERASR